MNRQGFHLSSTTERWLIVTITLLAFGLRVWQLSNVPPGWRDDELINSLVISQKALDGDWQLYYADASGHEALYHLLNAFMLGTFGANIIGIRLLSAFLGVLTIPLTWLVGRTLFGSLVGLLAAAALSLSFWSLMYSRTGIRHILMPVTMLLAFYFFWRGLQAIQKTAVPHKNGWWARYALTAFALAGCWIGVGFYVYFASRGVPLILLAFSGYLLLAARPLLRRLWPGLMLMFALAILLALPLFITLQQQPESEARVGELAVPLVEARAGNLKPLQKHVISTLSMFHNDGDGEWLYNIPQRAVFTPVVGLLFWLGVAIAVFYALKPLARWLLTRLNRRQPAARLEADAWPLAAAFLLLWWLAGISPGFVSVPPASLGHTILAQPVTFIFLALPFWCLSFWAAGRPGLSAALAALLLLAIAARDFPDYFGDWPARGMVRFLYRAEIADIAEFVNEHPDTTDFAVSGLLAGPWDKFALEIGVEAKKTVTPRWFQPERAYFLEPALSFVGYPDVDFAYETAFSATDDQPDGAYTLAQVQADGTLSQEVCFTNGLCLAEAQYDPAAGLLELTWYLARPLDIPPFQRISNPPPPGVYAGPRLLVFAQLLDTENNFVTGDDGLWVDPYSLQPGDIFRQQHRLVPPAGTISQSVAFGLYDPFSGSRILTETDDDQLTLTIGE